MFIAAIVSGIVIFLLAMVAASAGWKFYDARRKKQVADMLQTASGENAAPIAPRQPDALRLAIAAGAENR